MGRSNQAKMQPLESVESLSSDSATVQFLKGQSKQSVGLSLQNLDVHGFSEPTFFQHTVLSYFTLLPTYIRSLVGHCHRRKVSILRGLNGVVQSGEMLLVIGRPGSGCTTFLRTLAGSAHGVEVKEDTINYQGIPYSEFHTKCKSDAIYLAEDDVHFPELTLEETLAFASETRVPNPKIAHTSAAENARLVASTLNLGGSLTTPIGNDLIRGLSGGEKKRASIAEALLSGSAVQCYDNSTRGLDSATAFDFVTILRNSTKTLGTTAVVTIYQVSEEIYSTFDKVSVLYEGRQIFFGSTQHAAEYFTSMGFVRPARSTTADFLTSLTNPAQRIVQEGSGDQVPRTPDDFVAFWKQSAQYEKLMKEFQEFNYTSPAKAGNSLQYLRNKEFDASGKIRSSIYTISLYHQIRICVQRAFIRLRNNLAPVISGIVGNTLVAVILGSVFINLSENTSTFQTRAILIYYATMINACTPAFEVLTMWAQRPIVEKHSRYVFYHPVAEGIASMIADIPNKIATSLFFNICLYFITNLRREADSFFIFWLFSMVCMITMSMLFGMVGSFSRTYEQTLAPVAVIIFNFLIYAGLVIPPDYMVPALGWIRWINPVAYTYESLMINEFSNRQFPCGMTVPSGPSYGSDMSGKICAAVGALPGNNFVDGNSFLDLKYGYNLSHLWRNLGILIAMMVGFCCVHLVATEYIQAQKSKGDILLFRRQNKTQLKADEETGQHISVDDVKLSQVELTAITPKKENPTPQPALQQQSTVFHWSNLCYELKPGTLTALMGTTGAGKTTLLDVLASRKSVGVISGEIFVNGSARDKGFQRKTGYVQQNDLHLSTATVREALTFSALLRQPARIPKAEKLAYVDAVISMLEMESYSEAVVGVSGKGLNIEQRKRLTIAVELAARPELLLFLDEPTSGLDSQTAWSICTLLRKLANNGQAILCTIHQPSSELFQSFDRLLLLKDGKQLYFGDIGNSAGTMASYFERNGARAYTEGTNPAEWLLHVSENAHNRPSVDWAQVWANSPESTEIKRQLSDMEASADVSATGHGKDEYAASHFQQLSLVTCRIFQEYWRDPTYLYSKFALCAGAAFFDGFSFYMASKDIQGLTNILFSAFLLGIIFSTIDQQIIPRFIDGRALFEAREKQSKIYSWPVFVAANIIVEIFWMSLASVLVYASWYYPIGLFKNGDAAFSTAERGGLSFFLIWLFMIFTPTLSQALAAAMDDAQTAVNIAQLLFSLSLIFCGVLIPPAQLPKFWKFMYRVSPATYLVGGLIIAGVANTDLTCSDVETLKIELPFPGTETCGDYMAEYLKVAGGRVFNPLSKTICNYCQMTDTNSFLDSMGIDAADGWKNAGIFSAYVVFNIAATFFFYWLARVPKGKKN